jgi:Spermidine synthase tetramerisation domain
MCWQMRCWLRTMCEVGCCTVAGRRSWLHVDMCKPGIVARVIQCDAPCGVFPVPQLEEELQDDLKWCMLTKEILHVEKSKFQDVELIVTGPFGKVRRLDVAWIVHAC